MNIPPLHKEFVCHPTVCAVGAEYHIMLPVKSDMLFWVSIGGEKYCDESNGILRSAVRIHRVIVPIEQLDKAKGYTVCFRKIIDRCPYFPKTEDTVEIFYPFKPLEKTENINIYHVSDTHGMIEAPVRAASYFGDDLDLVILNGDIADFSGGVEYISVAYQIASGITGGTLPCVFSRGNHDLRGCCAENLAEFTPNQNGNSYYTFRIGCVWGILLDCGEDKVDGCDEYGGTVCCETFRRRETKFFENVIRNAAEEYLAEGVKYRLVVSHVPFTYNHVGKDQFGHTPFNIEVPLYTHWAELLRDYIHPNLMLSGHLHITAVSMPGSQYDNKGQCCPVIIGAVPHTETQKFTAAAITLHEKDARIIFDDQDQTVLADQTIPLAYQ